MNIMNEIKGVRGTFRVRRKEALTPHYIRIILEIPDEYLALLSDVTVGRHNKIFIPPAGATEIEFPDRENPVRSPHAAITRTYTTRSIDIQARELAIDFVAHGDNGPASAWALKAAEGDVLGIGMKTGLRPLVPAADSYLLVGDATALPVIAAILERLAPATQAKVIVEVQGKEDELQLPLTAGTQIEWLHNPHPEKGSQLAELAKRYHQSAALSEPYVFVASEYRTVRDLRSYFKSELGLDVSRYSATAYWKAGESEDESASERRSDRSR